MEKFEERKANLIKKFSAFPSWEDRFRLVVDYGKKLKPLPDSMRKDENLVPGCLSKVWLAGEKNEGIIEFKADADSAIVKGLVGILVFLYSGLSSDEIIQGNPDFLKELGLEQAVSANRRNGLSHMLKKIKEFSHL